MVAIVENPVWETEVYQLETDDPVLGGEDGIDNLQAKQLGNRTQYLKEQVELRTTVEDVAAQIAALVDSSPAALNTLNELAAALGDDANFSATINNALALKAPLASPAFTNVPTAPTAAPGTNNLQLANTAFVQALFSTMTAISDATTLVKGILKTATDALTQGGLDALTAVTPASLRSNTVTAADDPTGANNSTKLATTDWIRSSMAALAAAAGFSYSFTANGYFKFPSWLAGAIFQWGSASVPNDGSTAVTFPIAFPNNALTAQVSFMSGNITGAEGTESYNNMTTTGLTLQNGTNATRTLVYWTFGN